MPILISKTFEIVTDESASYGEAAERGFVFEEREFTFRELVREMEGFPECSDRPASGRVGEWLTSYAEQDFRTGAYESESIHFCRSNPPRLAKYWRKAMAAAGILKANR
jgi:hypothetical protein